MKGRKMKTYLVVTNDELEQPVAEFVGADKVAEFMGVSTNRFRKMLCYGFPKKHKYKAVVVEETQYSQTPESKKERISYTAKLRSLKNDRTEYWRKRYLDRKAKQVEAV